MKTAKAWLLAATVMLGAAASANALAGGGHGGGWHGGGWHGGGWHGGHAHVGVFIGAPLFYSSWYYPYAYYPAPYYYPPAAYPSYPSGPTSYVEQGQTEAAPAPGPAPRSDNNYWYYCPEAKAYYPYVQQCAAGWQKVSPQPPS
jgi:hypothetical protein